MTSKNEMRQAADALQPAPEQRAETALYHEEEMHLRAWARRWSGPDDLVTWLVKGANAIADFRKRLSAIPHPAPAAPPGYWLAPDELTQPMLNAAGFTAEDNSNRKRWAAFKKAAPLAADTVAVPREFFERVHQAFKEEWLYPSEKEEFAAEITRLLGETP